MSHSLPGVRRYEAHRAHGRHETKEAVESGLYDRQGRL